VGPIISSDSGNLDKALGPRLSAASPTRGALIITLHVTLVCDIVPQISVPRCPAGLLLIPCYAETRMQPVILWHSSLFLSCDTRQNASFRTFNGTRLNKNFKRAEEFAAYTAAGVVVGASFLLEVVSAISF
jgi:hypothetical protein